jgi:hypothetical protein
MLSMVIGRAGMASGTWNSTVTIELQGETRRFARITTTRDAASYLIAQWPGSRDTAYQEAMITCTKALQGELGDEIAFSSFVRAAASSRLRYLSASATPPDDFEQAIMIAARRSLVEELQESSKRRSGSH